MNGDTALKAEDFRTRALKGELSATEMREWLDIVRGNRRSAAQASKAGKSAKPKPDVDAMMDELDNLE